MAFLLSDVVIGLALFALGYIMGLTRTMRRQGILNFLFGWMRRG